MIDFDVNAKINFLNIIYILWQLLPIILFCMFFILAFYLTKVFLPNGND